MIVSLNDSLYSTNLHESFTATIGTSDEAAEKPQPQSSSFIPSWLRSKLPAAIGGSKEYEDEVEQLTMDSASHPAHCCNYQEEYASWLCQLK